MVKVNPPILHPVLNAHEADYLKEELGEIAEIRQEVPYGTERRSRIDLLIKPVENSPDSLTAMPSLNHFGKECELFNALFKYI